MIGRVHFAFVLFAVVAVARGADLAAAEPMPMDAGEVATPNHDPHPVSLMQAVATPNHDPHHATLMQAVATPNHDAMAAWKTVMLRAGPELAEPARPAFVTADTMIYARANARLRAAPNTAAGVVAKLAADTPLHAIGRSIDGVWWQVSLAGRPLSYVHRDAVTKNRVAKTKLPSTTVPATAAVAAVSPQPAPAPRSQGLLGRVTEAMDWLADVAGRAGGSAPKAIRTER